jgi:hypothetical protein
MKNFFYTISYYLIIAVFCFTIIDAKGQSTINITPSKQANPTLQWQGIYGSFFSGTSTYFVTDGSDINAVYTYNTTDVHYGRYNFSHPGFTNSQITKIILQVSCSIVGATNVGNGPGIARITIPICTEPWTSNLTTAQEQSLYSCLANAPFLTNNNDIATNNDGTATNNWYTIHDPSVQVDNSALWDPSATSIAIGFTPSQNELTINSMTMQIQYTPTSVPAITNNSICCAQTFSLSGNPALLTQSSGTAVGGGTGTYTYQWQSSINNFSWINISGAIAATYDPPVISQTTYYRRIVGSGSASASTSNTVVVTINSGIANNTVCCNQSFVNFGDPAVIAQSIALSGGNGTYTYQWQSSTDNVTWSNVSGAIAASYDPSTIYQTTYYRRAVNSTGVPTSYSNSVQITLVPGITGNSICCSQIFINSGDPSILTQTSGTNLQSEGDYSIQWQSSYDNLTWANISGAINQYVASYDPPVTTQTTYFRRAITFLTTGVVNYSNVVTIQINPDPPITNNLICCNQTYIGSADPSALAQSLGTTIGGGSGNYSIQWQTSPDNATWTALSGEINPSYDPPLLTQTTWYRRVITSGTAPVSTSNSVSATINALGSCTNKWTQKTQLAINRLAGVGFSIGNKGYVCLGADFTGVQLNDLWQYDPITDTWLQMAPFPGAGRTGVTAFVLNEKAYVGMGSTTGTTFCKDFYEYNPVTNSWARKADFPVVRNNAAGFAKGAYGYAVFGQSTLGVNVQELWQYLPSDPSNGLDVNGNPKGAWVQKQSYPSVDNNTYWSSSAMAISANAYGILSKSNSGGQLITYVYQYNPDDLSNGCDAKGNPKGTWLQKSGISAQVCFVPLFAVGGKGYFQTNYFQVTAYDPVTDTYSSPMASPFSENFGTAASFSINGAGYSRFGDYDEQSFWQYSPSDLLTGDAPALLSAGNSFALPYTLSCGTYPSAVTFTAQLSDVNGSFASPVSIGFATSTSSGTINVTIPYNTATGNKYRIRVISVSPAQIGVDNAKDLTIIDNTGNKSALYIDYQNQWSKQWFNDNSGNIATYKVQDGDLYYTGDFDGDGTDEIVTVAYHAGSTTDYINVLKFVQGDWTLLWTNNGSSSAGTGIYPYRYNLIVGDYDGDGKDELLGNDITGWTTLFKFSSGNWQWAWSDNGSTSNAIHPYKAQFYAGDFDGNGKDEILGCDFNGWTTCFGWDGSNFVWGWSDYGGANALKAYRRNMIAGDFNGDGKTELLGLGASAVMFNFTNNTWNAGWSSNGSNNIAGWAYPFASTDQIMAGNIDSDPKTELMFIQKPGSRALTIDFQNNQTGWNSNFQTYSFIGDWNTVDYTGTGSNTHYLMVKARSTDPKYLMAMRKYCSNYTVGMYKTSAVGFNYKMDINGTNINETEVAASVQISPNPAIDEFSVHVNGSEINQIQIFNLTGAMIYNEANLMKEMVVINSSTWGNGVYLIKVISDNNTSTTAKVIINK